jgi:hypothetical protein
MIKSVIMKWNPGWQRKWLEFTSRSLKRHLLATLSAHTYKHVHTRVWVHTHLYQHHYATENLKICQDPHTILWQARKPRPSFIRSRSSQCAGSGFLLYQGFIFQNQDLFERSPPPIKLPILCYLNAIEVSL